MYDGYVELRNAIVKSGVDDFKKGLKNYRTYIQDAEHHKTGVKNALRDVKDAADFFKSSWCSLLTGDNGRYILDVLIEETKMTDEEMDAFGI